ncbi:hypothetical protein [uncultured Clostridium sp.]|uniref:hypothetical protein n=1 Tax=uncultured Clostridium sp. TaxID=59620 RepID=UPI0025DDE730|nr:hypothetical protein [uncultured Clostridium sp.]
MVTELENLEDKTDVSAQRERKAEAVDEYGKTAVKSKVFVDKLSLDLEVAGE